MRDCVLCDQVASYMRAVLRTIAQCHAQKILHRDIKPGEESQKFMLPKTKAGTLFCGGDALSYMFACSDYDSGLAMGHVPLKTQQARVLAD